ncbi:hypothetical protein SHKM778_57200 [Streptomyces sp. KM77-8]|uniref:SDR family NAD(P)-dependent oxidoreductase n=1 Tax=Streptomyces haneummycinicus TaxID=3074435 RepID=A0AAT9HPW0_9ACTN
MTVPRALPALHATPLDLGGRTALVTGAAGGIGRACALRLAAAGAEVRAVDRDAAGLETLAGAARDLEGAVEPHVLDLTDLDAAERAAAGTDVLVNNAGLQLVRPIEEFPPDVFHTVLTVMLEAPSGSSGAPFPICTARAGAASSMCPRSMDCAPLPINPPMWPPNTASRGCPRPPPSKARPTASPPTV